MAAGADAYANFAFLSGHRSDEWVVLQPGDNTVNVIITADTNASIGFAFYDAWE